MIYCINTKQYQLCEPKSCFTKCPVAPFSSLTNASFAVIKQTAPNFSLIHISFTSISPVMHVSQKPLWKWPERKGERIRDVLYPVFLLEH